MVSCDQKMCHLYRTMFIAVFSWFGFVYGLRFQMPSTGLLCKTLCIA